MHTSPFKNVFAAKTFCLLLNQIGLPLYRPLLDLLRLRRRLRDQESRRHLQMSQRFHRRPLPSLSQVHLTSILVGHNHVDAKRFALAKTFFIRLDSPLMRFAPMLAELTPTARSVVTRGRFASANPVRYTASSSR